jgi:MFS family permease
LFQVLQTVEEAKAVPPPEATCLREISPLQWKSGLAAWLGWLFDGLDMHLYTLVAASFVASLVHTRVGDPVARIYSGWIQAAFLVGWALGGGFFGRIGDKLGRSRALSLTILTYALFTGLSFFVQTWWQLLICRFVGALGIGGEWAVGASLLSETWPKRWRPWIAAVLQTGVNIGVLLACLSVWGISQFAKLGYLKSDSYDRYVFLVGILPALLVFWIRRNVPEPDEWHRAKQTSEVPRVADLFRGPVKKVTLLAIGVCSLSLSGWWAFMFWHQQHLRTLPELASWSQPAITQLGTTVFFLVIAVSSFGNFAASYMAKRLGYRRSIAIFCVLFTVTILGSYSVQRSYKELLFWLPMVGFCSGVFGLFTMYLPPLFPTLLRTTGAGFSYNIGRIVAACGTVIFGVYSTKTDLRTSLLVAGLLFLPATLVAMYLPELSPAEGGTDHK